MTLSRGREKLLGRLRHRKTREREGHFLVEGPRVLREALAAGADLGFAVCSKQLAVDERGARLLEALRDAGVELHFVSERRLATLADTRSPQGVVAVCREDVATLSTIQPGPARDGGAEAPRYLVLDGVQDPGNLGTLVRVAAAFALTGVLALDGTVDPYNPKAVRASAGALFRIPLVRVAWAAADRWLSKRGVRVLVAEAGGVVVDHVDEAPPWALVVGGEAKGASVHVREAAAERVAVPMPGGADSLNAALAGAILLYDLTRRVAVA